MKGEELLLEFPEEYRDIILENNKSQGLEHMLEVEYNTKEEFLFAAFRFERAKESRRYWVNFILKYCDPVSIFKMAVDKDFFTRMMSDKEKIKINKLK